MTTTGHDVVRVTAWGAAWGVFISATPLPPELFWPRVAALAAAVWLLGVAASLRGRAAAVPGILGGAPGLAAAGLAVAALLGVFTFAAAVAAAVLHAARARRPSGPLDLGVAATAAAIAAWTAVGPLAAPAPAGVEVGALAVLVACGGLAASFAPAQHDGRGAGVGPRLAFGLALAGALAWDARAAGLWLAALALAAAWPFVHARRPLPRAWLAHAVPAVLWAVCSVDHLTP